jgi:hypothetical protein
LYQGVSHHYRRYAQINRKKSARNAGTSMVQSKTRSILMAIGTDG